MRLKKFIAKLVVSYFLTKKSIIRFLIIRGKGNDIYNNKAFI